MRAMRAKKGVKSMPKSGIADALATACEKKRSEMTKVLDALAELAEKETKGTGKFTIPGICMIKTRHKAARKAGKRMAFGKEVKVKAKAAHTVVKAFAVKALKSSPRHEPRLLVLGSAWEGSAKPRRRVGTTRCE